MRMEVESIKILNIFLLGIAFMLVFTAFNTMGNVQTTILKSAKNESYPDGYVEGFSGDGFTSLAIVYAVFTFANWFAPSVVAMIGPRLTMVGGGVTYSLFIAQLIYPNNIMLYGASALIGLGAAAIWVAQGNFLTKNSDESTMTRNSGIFWAMLQCSQLIGNLIIFFLFMDLTQIDKEKRTTVAVILLSICCVGTLMFLLLRPTPWADQSDTSSTESPFHALRRSLRLFVTPNMLLLSVTFFYTGLHLTFWSGVYGTCIGATNAFKGEAKSLVGMHGIFNGIGEIIGGLIFGIFGHMLKNRGRDPVVMLGFIVSMASYFLIFINIPADSPFGDTDEAAYIESSKYLAIFCSFLLGFGDACYNTQVFSILGAVYKDDSAPAFAVFKFMQSLSAAISFFYSNHITLYYQLLILTIFCVAGTISFCWIEWVSRKKLHLEQQQQQAATTSCALDDGLEEYKDD